MRYEKDENDHEIIISKMRNLFTNSRKDTINIAKGRGGCLKETNDEAAISKCRNTFCDRALDNVLSLLQYLILTAASSIVNVNKISLQHCA